MSVGIPDATCPACGGASTMSKAVRGIVKQAGATGVDGRWSKLLAVVRLIAMHPGELVKEWAYQREARPGADGVLPDVVMVRLEF